MGGTRCRCRPCQVPASILVVREPKRILASRVRLHIAALGAHKNGNAPVNDRQLRRLKDQIAPHNALLQ